MCHCLFQGFGLPGEVKLPLMSFWIELLRPPVHHFRIGEGSSLWSLHRSARLLLPTVAPHFGAEITTKNKVVALGADAAAPACPHRVWRVFGHSIARSSSLGAVFRFTAISESCTQFRDRAVFQWVGDDIDPVQQGFVQTLD